ncbi:MAG: C69 family dipeptidase [Synergistaceae bacterium]|nr:C69 family dipeptidase [Synergistaceae bacterium]
MALIFFASLAAFLFFVPVKSWACMTILVGKKASATGEVLVGHNEDAPGRFIIQTHLVKQKRRAPGTKIKFEPGLAELELNENRTSLFWSEAQTVSDNPADSAFCDFYVNGHGVVICSNNCANSKEDNPELLNGGIGYGLRRLVAEEAKSARDALEIACGLVEKYGYASSGRSYAFADKDEIYVLQIVNGKHYAAARVPDDEVAVIPNHYTIRQPEKNLQGYEKLISYAKERGWYKDEDGNFDFARVYQSKETFGLEKNTYRHVKAFEILLEMDLSDLLKREWQPLPFSIKPAHKVEIETLKKILRAHNHENSQHSDKPIGICNCDTLESTIVQIRHNPDRTILRKALGRPCVSPYVPWYFGINSLPEGYEDDDPEKALLEHFHLKPEDLDYKDNAWFRAMEVQAACDSLFPDGAAMVKDEIKIFEDKLEEKLQDLDSQIELRIRTDPGIAKAMMEGAVMTCTREAEELAKILKTKLEKIS